MNHYVYYLKSSLDKRLYIGVRSCKCPILQDPYMSSAKTVSKEYLQTCTKHILKIFTSRKAAISYEIYLHNKFEVHTNSRFFNAAKQTSTGFDTLGVKLSADIKERIRLGHLGVSSGMKNKTHSPETKAKMSLAGKGRIKTEEHKKAIGLANKGKPGYFGSTNPNAKAIICLDTGVVYGTTKEAALVINKTASTITTALKNPNRTAGGCKWAYLNK